MLSSLLPICGIGVVLLVAWGLSEDRRAVPWRTVAGGMALQLALALVLIGFPPATRAVLALNDAVHALQTATDAGTRFVFGYLGGPPYPFAESAPGAAFVLAFRALPLVLVISALAALLFHWGVLQWVARGFAWVLRRTLGVGGALGLGAATHIFVGMIEAPLLIRPWLLRMQRGELFALMTCGLAGIAGTMMVISTPAALAIAALMVPFRPNDEEARIVLPHPPASALDALVKGTAEGLPILAGIIAVLLVTVAIVTLLNNILGLFPGGLTLQGLFALPFRPLMWLIGVPWAETGVAAHLMGTKTVLNEFVSYIGLANTPAEALSERSRLILTYAMCGFANFGSLGILIGGMGAMVPERRDEIVALGLRAVLSGTLATCTSGALAGMLA
jgi:CNT family concentrative nucleoside transporter